MTLQLSTNKIGPKMNKLSFYKLVLLVIILSNPIFAQESYSLQFNGGIISPANSSSGLSSTVQFNYFLNPDVSFYLFTGYSAWDQNHVTFLEDWSQLQKQTMFKSYTSDEHRFIPLFVGSKVNFNTNKIFTAFFIAEIGYAHLTYKSYNNLKTISPDNGVVLDYYVDVSSAKNNSEELFGIGFGAGVTRQLSEKLEMILSYKINSLINSYYQGLFNPKGRYSIFLAGFSFKI